MRSCLSLREEEGYVEARRLLKERYGRSYKIAAAHVKRLIEGPSIKPEDGSALEQFSMQLSSCVKTLKEIGGKVVNENKGKQVNGKSSRKPPRGDGFSTQGKPPPPKTSQEKLKCPSCSSSHWVSRCDKFRKVSPGKTRVRGRP